MGGNRTLQRLARSTTLFFRRNSSTILTIVGAAGVVVTAVTAVKATPKALVLLEEAKEEKGEELTTLETVKVAAPVYIPSAVIGASTICCIVGANVLNKRTQAALASAYALVDSSYKEYKTKLKELYGEEVHNNVVNAIVKEKCSDVYLHAPGLCGSSSLELDEGDESEPRLFYDLYSKRYFETTMEKVLQAEYHLNRNYTLAGSVDLNMFYEFLGLCDIEGGDEIGWSVYDEIGWVDFNHRKVALDDGLECYVIEMPFEPSTFTEY